jgi:hypothetical protein
MAIDLDIHQNFSLGEASLLSFIIIALPHLYQSVCTDTQSFVISIKGEAYVNEL